jgi:RNA polymerase subunit RPABC4/transcription elongation factor Spt4
MKTKEKACLNCKILFEGERCPICNETEFTENWKGKLYVFNSEKSEVARNMKIKKNGEFAVKTK